ncbi:MAG: APC family permease [Phycisphaeraceae bacterium]|nr:MAG: APC family permease [Phycisphaeraceae bacterium]
MTTPNNAALPHQVGLPGAVLIGLGSMIGTGVFVGLALAADDAGAWLWLAILIAAALALCNGLASAANAGAHPRSGGAYEYGTHFLNPAMGFSAGWSFLCAKSASGATAALGVGGAIAIALGSDSGLTAQIIAGAVVLGITALAAGGLRRSNLLNLVIVVLVLGVLGVFVALMLPHALGDRPVELGVEMGIEPPGAADPVGVSDLLRASALVFIAFAGYARIATMTEEIRAPRRTIPRAVIITIGIVCGLYLAVAFVVMGAVGAETFGALGQAEAVAPLQRIATEIVGHPLGVMMAIAATAAMLGVLLNLVLGLSRILMAMARRADAPRFFAHTNTHNASPARAVWGMGLIVFALVLLGDVRLTWSLSAFSVLVYYAVNNLAALRIPKGESIVPKAIPLVGLIGCVLLASQVEWRALGAGIAILAVGFVLRAIWHRLSRRDHAA